MKTTQDMYNTIVRHLVKQGYKSTNQFGYVVYRSFDNSMCAIGCLIDSQSYSEEMEDGYGVRSWIITTAVSASGWPTSDSDIELLDIMQEFHDGLENPHLFRGNVSATSHVRMYQLILNQHVTLIMKQFPNLTLLSFDDIMQLDDVA